MADDTLRTYFVYTTGVTQLGANATVQVTIPILADAGFACHYITGGVKQASLIVLNWGGTVQVNDSGVGRTWFSQLLLFDEVTGNGRQPYVMPIPRLVARNSTLVITFVNPVATVTEVILSLHGYKLYGGEGPTPAPR